MLCLIVSTSGVLFKKEVRAVSIPSSKGKVGILDNHIPFICSLKKGSIVISHKDAADGETIEIDGGYAEFQGNTLTVLAEDKALVETKTESKEE